MKKLLYTFFGLTLLTGNIIAAGDADYESAINTMFIITLFLLGLVFIGFMFSESINDEASEKALNLLKKVWDFIVDTKPIEKEKEILLDHDYDGIKELDNTVPPWFNFLFYGTILFSIIYMINYHVIGSGAVQEDEYREEVRIAELQRQELVRSGALINEETVSFMDDMGTLAGGKEIYNKNCASCHGFSGEGLVGPNLTDDYWIHGNGIKDIFKVIKYGVPSKGMISWESQLNPTQIQDVANFVLSLHGTKPANPKPAEGEMIPFNPEPETPQT